MLETLTHDLHLVLNGELAVHDRSKKRLETKSCAIDYGIKLDSKRKELEKKQLLQTSLMVSASRLTSLESQIGFGFENFTISHKSLR